MVHFSTKCGKTITKVISIIHHSKAKYCKKLIRTQSKNFFTV